MEPELNELELRILGSLAEKEMTSAKSNPLTLNALTLACNQKSNRDPVMDLDEETVLRTLDALREKKLAVLVHQAGARVAKYEHLLRERLDLSQSTLAVMTVLLLRGPQTLGEIRTRTERMAPFESLEELSEVLAGLEKRQPALVTKLQRMPGQKERRYAHLLSGLPDTPAAASEPAPEAARVRIQVREERLEALEEQIEEVRKDLGDLREAFRSFRAQFE